MSWQVSWRTFFFFQGKWSGRGISPGVWQQKCARKLEQLSCSVSLVSFSLNNFSAGAEVYVCLLLPQTEFWQQHFRNRIEGLFVCASRIHFLQKLRGGPNSHGEWRLGGTAPLAGFAQWRWPAGSEQACPLHLLPREREQRMAGGLAHFPSPLGVALVACLATAHGAPSRAHS